MPIFPAKGERVVETDQGKIRIFLVFGQSHVSGGGTLDGLALADPQWIHQPGNAVPGCKIWDKGKRELSQRYDLTTVDVSRDSEAHGWKDLTPGFTSVDTTYPWETPPTDPRGGWDMMFASLWRQHTGERIFIVSMGPGGSTLYDPGGSTPHWLAGSYGGGVVSHLEVLMEAYWKPALAAAIAITGDRDKITLGGVVSIIGSSDSFNAGAIAAYETNMTDVITLVRAAVAQSGDDDDIPWVVCQSPLPDSNPNNLSLRDDVQAIRDGQADTVASLSATNIELLDLAGYPYGSDNLHLNWLGNARLGASLFSTTKAMLGYVGPEGD